MSAGPSSSSSSNPLRRSIEKGLLFGAMPFALSVASAGAGASSDATADADKFPLGVGESAVRKNIHARLEPFSVDLGVKPEGAKTPVAKAYADFSQHIIKPIFQYIVNYHKPDRAEVLLALAETLLSYKSGVNKALSSDGAKSLLNKTALESVVILIIQHYIRALNEAGLLIPQMRSIQKAHSLLFFMSLLRYSHNLNQPKCPDAYKGIRSFLDAFIQSPSLATMTALRTAYQEKSNRARDALGESPSVDARKAYQNQTRTTALYIYDRLLFSVGPLFHILKGAEYPDFETAFFTFLEKDVGQHISDARLVESLQYTAALYQLTVFKKSGVFYPSTGSEGTSYDAAKAFMQGYVDRIEAQFAACDPGKRSRLLSKTRIAAIALLQLVIDEDESLESLSIDRVAKCVYLLVANPKAKLPALVMPILDQLKQRLGKPLFQEIWDRAKVLNSVDMKMADSVQAYADAILAHCEEVPDYLLRTLVMHLSQHPTQLKKPPAYKPPELPKPMPAPPVLPAGPSRRGAPSPLFDMHEPPSPPVLQPRALLSAEPSASGEGPTARAPLVLLGAHVVGDDATITRTALEAAQCHRDALAMMLGRAGEFSREPTSQSPDRKQYGNPWQSPPDYRYLDPKKPEKPVKPFEPMTFD